MPGDRKHLARRLSERSLHDLRRHLTEYEFTDPVLILRGEKSLINLSTNDYLRLSIHPSVKENSLRYIEKYGTGSNASRLITGTQPFHVELESQIAKWLGTESSLLFNSGYQMNVSVIGALADQQTDLFFDRLNHNSLIQGALASRGKLYRYRHLDYDHLTQLLRKSIDSDANRRRIIVTESLFSMDGDIADIGRLYEISESYDCMLVVDEAHAIGIYGDGGRGLCHGIPVDIVLGTFGKAFGSFGAYLAADSLICDYLINFCGGFIYTTSLPPGVVGATLASLALMNQLDSERSHLMNISNRLRQLLNSSGVNILGSRSHIIPIITGDASASLHMQMYFQKHGFLCQSIRPPTVEPNMSRVRLSLNASLTDEDLSRFIEVVQNYVSSGNESQTQRSY